MCQWLKTFFNFSLLLWKHIGQSCYFFYNSVWLWVRAAGGSREKLGVWRKWDVWEWQMRQSRLVACPRSLTLCSLPRPSHFLLYLSRVLIEWCSDCKTGRARFGLNSGSSLMLSCSHSWFTNTPPIRLGSAQFTSQCERRCWTDAWHFTLLKFIRVKRTASVPSYTLSSA